MYAYIYIYIYIYLCTCVSLFLSLSIYCAELRSFRRGCTALRLVRTTCGSNSVRQSIFSRPLQCNSLFKADSTASLFALNSMWCMHYRWLCVICAFAFSGTTSRLCSSLRQVSLHTYFHCPILTQVSVGVILGSVHSKFL